MEALSTASTQPNRSQRDDNDSERSALSYSPIRVATYNINWDNQRLDAVVDAIRRSNADIVCLQETNARSASVLRRELSHDYDHIRFYGSDDECAAAGFGLMSRIAIHADTLLPAEHGLFGTYVVELQIGGQPIQLIVVHLQPTLFRSGMGLAGPLSALSALEDAEKTHQDEILRIVRHVRSDIPVLIVGDFNSVSAAVAPTILKKQGFVDSFASVNENPESHPTWHWPAKLGDIALRIDYVFHSPEFRTIESRCIKTEGSDHYLLVSQLELVKKE